MFSMILNMIVFSSQHYSLFSIYVHWYQMQHFTRKKKTHAHGIWYGVWIDEVIKTWWVWFSLSKLLQKSLSSLITGLKAHKKTTNKTRLNCGEWYDIWTRHTWVKDENNKFAHFNSFFFLKNYVFNPVICIFFTFIPVNIEFVFLVL